MKETYKSGIREFLITIALIVVLMFAGEFIIYLIPEYKMAGGIISLLLLCVLGFFVLTRYTAVYTYELTDDRLKVNRTIGHRNKELGIYYNEIKRIGPDISTQGMQKQNVYVMIPGIRKKKNAVYVSFKEGKVKKVMIFRPSAEFEKRLRELREEAK